MIFMLAGGIGRMVGNLLQLRNKSGFICHLWSLGYVMFMCGAVVAFGQHGCHGVFPMTLRLPLCLVEEDGARRNTLWEQSRRWLVLKVAASVSQPSQFCRLFLAKVVSFSC